MHPDKQATAMVVIALPAINMTAEAIAIRED